MTGRTEIPRTAGTLHSTASTHTCTRVLFCTPNHFTCQPFHFCPLLTSSSTLVYQAEGVTFHAFNFANYGVPQTRTRLFAGTPSLIHALRDDASLRVAAPVTPADLLTPPPGATRIRASGGKCVPQFMRSIHVPTWCLLTACKPVYVTADVRCVRVMTVPELLALQKFPGTFRMPSHLCTEAARVRLIGNAVPPLMSRLLLKPLAR